MPPPSFPCTRCGACCRVIGYTDLPLPSKEDGSCAHLTSDGLCSIYEQRPDFCRVDALAAEFEAAGIMSKAAFISAQAGYCNTLVDLFGLGDRFKVRLPEGQGESEREPERHLDRVAEDREEAGA